MLVRSHDQKYIVINIQEDPIFLKRDLHVCKSFVVNNARIFID